MESCFIESPFFMESCFIESVFFIESCVIESPFFIESCFIESPFMASCDIDELELCAIASCAKAVLVTKPQVMAATSNVARRMFMAGP